MEPVDPNTEERSTDEGLKTVLLNRAQLQGGGEERVHYLVSLRGPSEPVRQPITPLPLLIGRSRECALHIEDRMASSRHCRVRTEGNAVVVEDLGSSNGSFIDGQVFSGRAMWPVGSTLQVGLHLFRHEWRSPRDVQKEDEHNADLRKAGAYLRSLLPDPRREGPVHTNWVYVPAAALGGDAFGVHEVDPDRTAIYLLDVSGHGAGAALHTATVINTLRQAQLPGVNHGDPAAVLAALNRAFPMDRYNGVYFSIWYGVFHHHDRRLSFASAGHPPAVLKGEDGEVVRLQTRRLAIGVAPEETYETRTVEVPADSTLYVFSDGVYELDTPADDWTFEAFCAEVAAPEIPGLNESERLYRRVLEHGGAGALQDDFTLLVARFPPPPR